MRLILRILAAAFTAVALALSLRPDPPPAEIPAYYAALPAPAHTTMTTMTTPPPTFPTWTVDEILTTPEGQALLLRRRRDALAADVARMLQSSETAETNPTPTSRSSVSTTTTAGTAPTPTTGGSSVPGRVAWRPAVERWRDLVSRYFSPDDVEMALGILRCESLGDPQATNRSSGTAGLFQHRPRYWQARSAAAGIPDADVYDPEANVRVAAWLVYEDGGWQHWGNGDGCEAWARAQTGGG